MKQVLKVSVNGKFRQFLLLSETRFINTMLKEKEGNSVTVTLVTMDKKTFNVFF